MNLVALLNLGRKETKRTYERRNRAPGSKRRPPRVPARRGRAPVGSYDSTAQASSRTH